MTKALKILNHILCILDDQQQSMKMRPDHPVNDVIKIGVYFSPWRSGYCYLNKGECN